MENFFLFLLSLLILLNAIMIITNKNPVHSILFLVLVFTLTTGFLLILGVEFIAMLFLVVYVGAITVLFLFVVMMLNVKIVELNERFLRYLPIGLFIGVIFFVEIIYLINNNLSIKNLNINIFYNDFYSTLLSTSFVESTNFFETVSLYNIEQIANVLYSKYVYLFLLGGVVLLIAMIGAIVLTLNQKHKNKKQDYYTQTVRNITESIRFLK